MNVNRLIRECATSEGADFFGVADVVPAREAIREQGGDLVASFPRAVSIGLKLFHPIVDQLPQRLEDNMHAQNYGHHCYTVINQRLDLIASKVADLLQAQGHRVYPVPASQTINTARSIGVFSNKMAAHMAGLGWIGKSCLLVTPENGPRCRWATVLTDAPLAQPGDRWTRAAAIAGSVWTHARRRLSPARTSARMSTVMCGSTLRDAKITVRSVTISTR